MINTAISDNSVNYVPLTLNKRFLVGILIAVLVHTSLIWLLNRHTDSYDDSAHYLNQNLPEKEFSITMIAASTWMEEPEPVELSQPLPTAPESPTTPAITLDKEVQTEKKIEKPVEPVKTQKLKKQRKEKSKENVEKQSVQPAQKQHLKELETNGIEQINSQGGMSRATTSQPVMGQGNSESDNYRTKLRQEIERHKRYPRKAKRMRQEGTVTVNFMLQDDGSITTARVTQSSGYSAMDNEALKALGLAKSVGPKPANLAADITLKISFELN
ncbi:energy transducer TonB [Xenorhabdus budapestensis]|uniref:Energy transducer TonB n=1 Tax=Xenorhabdus budapestensis TaxID=290110 RepID=A0ABX7VK35_XENBU|nr:energy transducer TonB [Xenorhabdus budapestensis]QTL39875.1 energy transducer TonB [Xenorhabdus budapestensis]